VHCPPSRAWTARRIAAGTWRDTGFVRASARDCRGAFTLAKRRASSRSIFSVTAASMTAARSPSGTEARMSALNRSSLSRSAALAVNCTL
jgi:hypothetical protein